MGITEEMEIMVIIMGEVKLLKKLHVLIKIVMDVMDLIWMHVLCVLVPQLKKEKKDILYQEVHANVPHRLIMKIIKKIVKNVLLLNIMMHKESANHVIQSALIVQNLLIIVEVV